MKNSLSYDPLPVQTSQQGDQEINLLVIDERRDGRTGREIDCCRGVFNPFLGYWVNYDSVNSFADAQDLISEDPQKFYAAITWIRQNTLDDAVDFAFFQEGKMRTLMMRAGEIDPGSEFFLRRYVQLLPAKNLYEASLLVLEDLVN